MRFEPELALSPPVNQSAVTFAPNRKTRDSEELELISFFLVRTAGLEPAQGYPQGILSLFWPNLPSLCADNRTSDCRR
jgi:hypothetical protein